MEIVRSIFIPAARPTLLCIVLVDKNYFNHREFSFTLEGDIYLRYQSFKNQEELEKSLQQYCPLKIDIGAVFNARPKDHRQVLSFQPKEKELVFDIDMTDYDEVRNCCSGAEVCSKCWQYMSLAVKIIDTTLREDFGFNHLLWVFSGRRGIHCWVCDESARQLTVSARSAIAEYLQLIRGGANQYRKVNLHSNNIHPSIERALDVIKLYFSKICLTDQDVLGTEDGIKKVLQIIPDEELRLNCVSKLEKVSGGSTERWKLLRDCVVEARDKNQLRKTNVNILKEIMLQLTYPRLDIEVSKGLNHLLKAPFCVHPKTGKICVPIDPCNIDTFDVSRVPTVSQIIEEISEYDATCEGQNNKKIRDYKKTALLNSISYFENFLKQMESKQTEQRLQLNDSKMEI